MLQCGAVDTSGPYVTLPQSQVERPLHSDAADPETGASGGLCSARKATSASYHFCSFSALEKLCPSSSISKVTGLTGASWLARSKE